MPPLIVNPADYDAFRVDLQDVPAQDCTDDIACAVRAIIEAIGEDPNRQGLQRTPERVARAYQELTAGYHVDPVKLINDAIFDVTYDEMVIVRDIDYFSLCEHHLLPFIGRAHVGYIPAGKVIGLSKIPRSRDVCAATTNPRADDAADCRVPARGAQAAGRGGGVRGGAYVRCHAWRQKAQCPYGHQRYAWRL